MSDTEHIVLNRTVKNQENEIFRLTINVYTWDHESNGLYDFESRSTIDKHLEVDLNQSMDSVYEVSQSGGDIRVYTKKKYAYPSPSSTARGDPIVPDRGSMSRMHIGGLDGVAESLDNTRHLDTHLFDIRRTGDNFFLVTSSGLNNFDVDCAHRPPKRQDVWKLASRKNCEDPGDILSDGDVIKLGRQLFKVLEIATCASLKPKNFNFCMDRTLMNQSKINLSIDTLIAANVSVDQMRYDPRCTQNEKGDGVDFLCKEGNDKFTSIASLHEDDIRIHGCGCNENQINIVPSPEDDAENVHNTDDFEIDIPDVSVICSTLPNTADEITSRESFIEEHQGESYGYSERATCDIFFNNQSSRFGSPNHVDMASENAGPQSHRGAMQASSFDGRCCRICYDTEERLPENPLIQPCKCSGSMKYVHLVCLRHWLQGRLNVSDSNFGPSVFFLRTLCCELCKNPFPAVAHSSAGDVVNIYLLPEPTPPYILLEAEYQHEMSHLNRYNEESKGVYIIRLPHDRRSSIKIGRSHDSDISVNDISVSRSHSLVEFTPIIHVGWRSFMSKMKRGMTSIFSGRKVGSNSQVQSINETLDVGLTGGYFSITDNKSKFGTLISLSSRSRLHRQGITDEYPFENTNVRRTSNTSFERYIQIPVIDRRYPFSLDNGTRTSSSVTILVGQTVLSLQIRKLRRKKNFSCFGSPRNSA